MGQLKKAELIEGTVYMAPPVSHEYHGLPHANLGFWLTMYRASTPGVSGGDNSTLRLDVDNEPQPDLYLMIAPAHGGQARISADGFLEGAPELIAEIAASTASYDLHAKLQVYRRSGVKEYIVWRTYDRQIDYFLLNEGRYESLTTHEGHPYRSPTFPGLWLDADAMLAGNLAGVIHTLQQGMDTPEHAAFVQSLVSAAHKQ